MKRVLEFFGSLIVAPVLLCIAALTLAFTDLAHRLFARLRPRDDRMPNTSAASVVIPNWNGRDLLERYLPSVVEALQGNPANEIIVVDNGSTDGSAAYLREHFPDLRVVELPVNLGFGGGSNLGFRAARNDIVVLLNSDMRVDPAFLQPLLDGFTNPQVFAVSCQIFLSDPSKRREETGLTEGRWENGRLRVSHRDDASVDTLFPCFYAGGGSAAFDRAKFLELGGFDEIFAPFYLEDTDLGFNAWKRGWTVFYQPASVVFHEHRGTIGRKFSSAYIEAVLKKNYLLFAWKNIGEWPRLAACFWQAWTGAVASAMGGHRPLRTNFAGIWRAFTQLPGAIRSRRRARSLATLSDTEAFAHSRPSHFRDLFFPVAAESEKLRILFVSPYPILPTVHGGAVFMYEALRELSQHHEVHALILLDTFDDKADQTAANRALESLCASVELILRPKNREFASSQPHAVTEWASTDVRWAIDRTIYMRRIDVVQLEYTPMGQYGEPFRNVVSAIFEHDIYFQSVARTAHFLPSALARARARFEYLRALRFELQMLPRFDQIQVCTRDNRDYLVPFAPALAPRIRSGLRAAINAHAYQFPGGPREPKSLLFIGSSRHEPNRAAVEWFIDRVLPRVIAECPELRFYLAGFDPSKDGQLARYPQIEMLGTIADVKPLLAEKAVFICPILSGSGVRVKLLEAFAAGTPVVSTRIGAEGLARTDGDVCALADEPDDFASRTLALLRDPEAATDMARRARAEIEQNWDSTAVIGRLERSYRERLRTKKEAKQASDSAPSRGV
jgi:GT2 family glycosyltransferase/glycosyltransferase involved in cell wall biosynthesis